MRFETYSNREKVRWGSVQLSERCADIPGLFEELGKDLTRLRVGCSLPLDESWCCLRDVG
jgi:hypothetical protein